MTYEIAKIHNQIQHAKMQLHKWRFEARVRETHAERVEAGARVLLWESQLRVHNSKLTALISNLKSA